MMKKQPLIEDILSLLFAKHLLILWYLVVNSDQKYTYTQVKLNLDLNQAECELGLTSATACH